MTALLIEKTGLLQFPWNETRFNGVDNRARYIHSAEYIFILHDANDAGIKEPPFSLLGRLLHGRNSSTTRQIPRMSPSAQSKKTERQTRVLCEQNLKQSRFFFYTHLTASLVLHLTTYRKGTKRSNLANQSASPQGSQQRQLPSRCQPQIARLGDTPRQSRRGI